MFTRKRLPSYVKDKWAWWKNVVARDPEELEEDEEEVTPATGGLLRFLENELLPWYMQRRREFENRLLIRARHSAMA